MALSRRILHDELDCSLLGHCTPPPPLPWSPPSTPIHINNRSHVRSLVVVVAAAVLALCLLSLACYAVHRYRSYRRRRRAASTLAAAWGPPQPLADDLLLVGGGGGEEQPYHVWYIRTVGLEQAVIGTIAVCEYRKEEGLVEGTDCAVCLGEFTDGEQLRLLPKCSHAFHVPCIDTWLRSHVNCPLCRAPVLAPPPSRHLPPPPPLPSPSEVAAVVPSAVQAAAGEDLEEDGNSTVSPLPAEVPSSMGSFSSEESEIWVPIDLGDGGLGAEMVASYDTPAPEEDRDVELQPVGRSMSMDSSAVASLLLRMRLAGCSRDGGRKPSDGSANKKGGTGEDNRKGAPWPDAPPLEMERSMSGGRLFLSRLSGRARGGIGILPL